MKISLKHTASIAIILAFAATPYASGSQLPEYKLNQVKAANGKLVSARWDPCRQIRYSIDMRYLHVNKTKKKQAAADIKRSFNMLGKATGLTFRRTQNKNSKLPTKRVWRSGNQHVSVVFMSPSHPGQSTDFLRKNQVTGVGYVAAWTWWASKPALDNKGRAARRIHTATLAVDADQYKEHPWGFKPGPRTGALLLHELGHVAGLDHVDNPGQIMYGGRISDTTYVRNRYQKGDRKGLAHLGAKHGCLYNTSLK